MEGFRRRASKGKVKARQRNEWNKKEEKRRVLNRKKRSEAIEQCQRSKAKEKAMENPLGLLKARQRSGKEVKGKHSVKEELNMKEMQGRSKANGRPHGGQMVEANGIMYRIR